MAPPLLGPGDVVGSFHTSPEDGVMKRSIAMQSMLGMMLAMGATAAATGCGQEEAPGLATETAALDQPAAASPESDGGNMIQRHCPHDVPAALNPPADATLAASFQARG